MNQDKNIGDRGNGPRPSHHISSIAHLFFDNQGIGSKPETGATDTRLLVMGCGRDTSSAYSAAGLGQHLLDQSVTVGERGITESSLPIRQVFFAEPSPVRFSGVSQLQPGSFRPPVEGEFVPWPLRRNSDTPILRLFPGKIPGEDFSGGMLEGRFFIRHQDLPGQAELSFLETQNVAHRPTGFGDDGSDGLIWCVQASSAVSLELTSRLGRMINIVNPQRIFLLIYPDLNPSLRSGPREATAALLERSLHLLRYVSGDRLVSGILMGESPEEKSIQLAALSRQLAV